MNKSVHLVLALSLVLFIFSCGGAAPTDQNIAYVSANRGSEYETTFKELNVGLLFDFNFSLPQADKSLVTLGLEGYRNGEAAEKAPPSGFFLRRVPEPVKKGRMGFGLINHQSEHPLFFFSLPGQPCTPPA